MKKCEGKEGDIFRFLITDGKKNYGRTVYGYGRVVNEITSAFYSNDALPPEAYINSPSMENILKLDVAFIVGISSENFNDGTYEIIGNIPLEEKFRQPIYFYDRSVGEDICKVSDIWNPDETILVHISELHPRIERWGAYHHINIEKRLGVYRVKS